MRGGIGKDHPQNLLAFAVPLRKHLGSADLIELSAGLARDDPCEHRLARARFAGEEDTLDRSRSDSRERVVVEQRKLDQFSRSSDHGAETAEVLKRRMCNCSVTEALDHR